MKIYDKLLDIVESYLCDEPIEEGKGVISAYTLWTAVKNYTDRINYILNDNSKLLEFINYIFSEEAARHTFTNEEAAKDFGIKKPIFGPIKFKKLTSSFDENTATISLFPTGIGNKDKRIDIHREFFDDNYYSDQMNDFLVRNCMTGFDEIFDELKYYSRIKCSGKQIVHDEDFDIVISHNEDSPLTISIELNKSVDKHDSQYKKYYNEEFTIHDIILAQQDEILKHIPVKINKLDKYCNGIIQKRIVDTIIVPYKNQSESNEGEKVLQKK
ncbi:MAG: hypothetical protein IK137_01090 [Bacilli bacterium]|nr:hypothetical protein [Bacilli bacterium]